MDMTPEEVTILSKKKILSNVVISFNVETEEQQRLKYFDGYEEDITRTKGQLFSKYEIELNDLPDDLKEYISNMLQKVAEDQDL